MEQMSLRERLLERYGQRPLWSLLILDPRHRWLVGLFALVVLAIGLGAPRIWVVTPKDFRPRTKVRAIELVQAWALKRSAMKLTAEGKDEEALRAWGAAIVKNPGNPELLRGALRTVLRSDPVRTEARGEVLGRVQWLLRLTHTNRADVELAATAYEKFEAPAWVLDLLETRESQLSPSEESCYLKALFQVGRVADFGSRWPRVAEKSAADPELMLYRDAYLAGWGPPGTIAEAGQRLAEASRNPATSVLATRLQLAVFAALLDVDGCQEGLQRLEQAQKDRFIDHQNYWNLLKNLGREAEARTNAERYAVPPSTRWEAIQMVECYVGLRMTNQALKLLERYAPRFADADAAWAAEVWVAWADLLAASHQWDELGAFSLRLRSLNQARTLMAGYSHFTEGWMHHALAQTNEALECFEKAAKLGFPNPSVGLRVATKMLAFGYPDLANAVLEPLEKESARNAEYWRAVYEATYDVKKDHLKLLRAATKAYDLQPANGLAAINYAAALLINRERVEEACKLTLAFLRQNPRSLVAVVDHSFALAMNHRLPEAENLLKTVNPLRLNDLESSAYYLGWFEIDMDARRFDAAREDLEHIQTQYLFPNQIEWLDRKRAELAAAGPATGGTVTPNR